MQTATINKSSSSLKYTEWTENIPSIKNNRLLLASNWMWWKVRINWFCVPLYHIIIYSFCTVLKYVVLEGKLCPPWCDRYLLNIHYYCPLTEAESVTKDCASRRNHLQSGQASLPKHGSIQQHIPPLPEMVCKWILRIFDTHIEVVFFFLFLLILNNIYVLLRLHMQNRRKKWNFPLNFRTIRKLSDLYSRIFQNYWLFNHLDVHLVWTTSETLQN